MSGIIEGYNYDTHLRLSYGGHVFISYRQKNEGERGRLGEGTKGLKDRETERLRD